MKKFGVLSSRLAVFQGALLGAVLLLCGCKGRWEDYEKIIGYKGKARANPFLASERLLEELGHEVRDVKTLVQLPSHDAVIFLSGEGVLPEGRARQLLRWTYSGGHLVYCLSGTRPYNDFEFSFGSFLSAFLQEEQEDAILKQLGVGVKKRFPTEEAEDLVKGTFKKAGESAGKKDGTETPPTDSKTKPKDKEKAPADDEEDDSWLEAVQHVTWNGNTFELSLGGHQHLMLERDMRLDEFSAGPKNESLALHLRHGTGRVTVLAHARPFRNRWVGERDHARWLSALVGEGREREVLWVAAATGSFFGLLWQHAWMAVVTLAACLVFWLWRQMPRFGPLAEVELDPTRRFASHVGALGEFFWRVKRSAVLVAAAREAVWTLVRERHRSLDDGSRKMNDVLAEAISSRSGLPAKRVAAAFDMPPPASAHHFVALMRDLQTIRRAL
ncbi:MAG: DUF4350 domain-containing protein [Prosthecobacter sp.]